MSTCYLTSIGINRLSGGRYFYYSSIVKLTWVNFKAAKADAHIKSCQTFQKCSLLYRSRIHLKKPTMCVVSTSKLFFLLYYYLHYVVMLRNSSHESNCLLHLYRYRTKRQYVLHSSQLKE